MWRVEPNYNVRGQHMTSAIHIDMILHSAHFIGVAGTAMLPKQFSYHNTLSVFQLFYVNKYTGHL